MNGWLFRLCGAALLSLAGALAAAADPVPQTNATALWFENWLGLTNASLTIQAPDGRITEVTAERGTPVFRLAGGAVLDGRYSYELRAATEETVAIVNAIDNGRGDAARTTMKKAYVTTGSFTVFRGVIVPPDATEEPGK